jgi:isopentenyl-diphosphate delta-isomerase
MLREAGTVTYNHPDPLTGLVEREYNHLFVGIMEAELIPDPSEVSETAFVTAEELQSMRSSSPFSAWFPTVFEAALDSIRELAGPIASW